MNTQQQLNFGDYPVMLLAENPLSPRDGQLARVRGLADVVTPYRGYTICAVRALGVGVIYRPDGQPLQARGLWQVVPSYEAAVEVINLDLYWNTLEGTKQVSRAGLPTGWEPWATVGRLCDAAGCRWHDRSGRVMVEVYVGRVYIGVVPLGTPEEVATWSQTELEVRIARQLKQRDGIILIAELAA
jgi:hypothetical protein